MSTLRFQSLRSIESLVCPHQRKFLDDRCRLMDPGRSAMDSRLPVGPDPQESTKVEKCIDKCPAIESSLPEKHPCPMAEQLEGKIAGKAEKSPSYFSQPEDTVPLKSNGSMEPIGPWATGRPDFSPTSGMTGVRPVVDRYTITRYSPAEWQTHNRTFFNQSNNKIHEAELAASNAKQCTMRVFEETDKNQLDNRDRLSIRAGEVHRCKSELERLLRDLAEEIELLEGERRRVKQSLSVLTTPESIAGEFLQLRSTRMEPDLVRDQVEEELVKEVALCEEIRNLLNETRKRIEEQATELKAAKNRIEFDWTDKKDAYETDTTCIGLTNESPLILWKPGATRFPADQSTPAGYEHATREFLEAGEQARQRSIGLRKTLDAIYVDSVRDLRTQANRVDAALAEKISLTERICQQLEQELLRCLHNLASTEELIENLRASIKRLDYAMKVAQTRLENRLYRRNVESCRDVPQFGLIEEVKILGQNVTAMKGQLNQAENARMGLVKARTDLELEIIVKRKSLYVDKERGQLLRSFYPSAVALSGH